MRVSDRTDSELRYARSRARAYLLKPARTAERALRAAVRWMSLIAAAVALAFLIARCQGPLIDGALMQLDHQYAAETAEKEKSWNNKH